MTEVEMSNMSDTTFTKEDSPPVNMENNRETAIEDEEDGAVGGGGGHGDGDDDVRDGGIDTRDMVSTNVNTQETANGDAEDGGSGDVRDAINTGDMLSTNNISQETANRGAEGDGGGGDRQDAGINTGDVLSTNHSDQETASEDLKVNDQNECKKVGSSDGGDDVPNNDINTGDVLSTNTHHQEMAIVDSKINDEKGGDVRHDKNTNQFGDSLPIDTESNLQNTVEEEKDDGEDDKGDGDGDGNHSDRHRDSSSIKMDSTCQDVQGVDDASDDIGGSINAMDTGESLPTNLQSNLQTNGQIEKVTDGDDDDGGKVVKGGDDSSNEEQINKPENKVQTSDLPLDDNTKENLGENILHQQSIAQNEIMKKVSNRISEDTNTMNTIINSPKRLPNGAVHALTEIAKITKHTTRDNVIQNRQVMSVKTKNYPDRSAQRMLRDRRDKVLESLMRKDGAQKNDATYTYGKFSPIKTDKLPEVRGGAHAASKKSPLLNPVNEPFNAATNKRTLERRRLKLSREIAALDMLPETNVIKPDELLKTVVNDGKPKTRSSLIGKVRERKLRSETKKELQLRRRKMPRMADYNRLNFELSSTSYRPKRNMPKVLPKLGNCNKKGGKEVTNKEGGGEAKKSESGDENQDSKSPGKHVSFGPICIINIDEEFAMFVQANGQPFKNAFRSKLRRQQASDCGFSGGKYGQLSPVRKQAKSTITDKSFSTDKKPVPQFTAKPVATLPKIGQAKPDIKTESTTIGKDSSPSEDHEDRSQSKQSVIEKKPNKSILKIAKYQPPDLTLTVKCSPEFRAIMDSLHGVNPSPFLLK